MKIGKYIHKIFTCVFLLVCLSCYSQNQRKIDSLINLVNNSPEDSNKVNLYYSLSRHYDVFKSKENIEWNLTALDLSKKIKFSRGIKRHYADIIRFLFQRGVYDLAIAYYHDYENYLIENNFNDELLASYNMYGNLLSRQKKTSEALKYYHKARGFQLTRKNYPMYANVLNNISIVCIHIEQYDSALIYSSIAISIFKQNNSSSALANSILGIGEIYLKKGDLKNAESKVFESIDIYQAVNEIHGLCNCNYVLGQIYLQGGRYEEAIVVTTKALKSAKELHFLEIERDCFNNLSQAYHLLNNDSEAYKNHVLYKSISDSLAAENLQGKMLEMEVKYDISQKEGQLKEQQFEIDSKNKQRNYLVLIVLVILILFFISFRAYNQKKKANAIIYEQKKLVDEKQKEVFESINYAKRIQFALLANSDILKTNLPEHFVLFKPKDIVSGDFYWATKKDNRFYLAVCDSTGHGVPGAFMSLLNISFLNEAITEKNILEPNQILNHVRKRLIENVSQEGGQDGMDGILLCIETNSNSNKKTLTYSSGNNAPILISNNVIIELSKDKMPIGKGEKSDSFTLNTIDCKYGDTIYLYTDGFADQFGGPKGKKFKYKQLNELLLSISTQTSNNQSEILSDNFNTWKGNLDQVDDVCIVGIRI